MWVAHKYESNVEWDFFGFHHLVICQQCYDNFDFVNNSLPCRGVEVLHSDWIHITFEPNMIRNPDLNLGSSPNLFFIIGLNSNSNLK